MLPRCKAHCAAPISVAPVIKGLAAQPAGWDVTDIGLPLVPDEGSASVSAHALPHTRRMASPAVRLAVLILARVRQGPTAPPLVLAARPLLASLPSVLST